MFWMTKRKFYWLLLLSCITTNVIAQDFSNKGKDFWITYPAHIDGENSAMGIYITSDVAASGTIYVGSSKVIQFTVTPNSVVRKFLGPNGSGDAANGPVYQGQIDGIYNNSAIHVVSDKPVVVYAHIIKSHRSGASLILPSTVWGRKYIVPSYFNVGNTSNDFGYGTITVVAKDTNTIVEITPTIDSRSGLRKAGVPYQITLTNPGDVYQVESLQDSDISGTLVESISSGTGGCKPIAVFSSTTWSAFGCADAGSGDNLYQQLFPIGAWGKNFLTCPAATRIQDIFRIFVTDTTTNVTITEKGVIKTLPRSSLINKAFYEYETGNPLFIQADKPVSTLQYFTTQKCDGYIGDPEMIALNPVEQTVNNITVFSAHQKWVPVGQSDITNCYLNIIINSNAAASFMINGNSPTSSFIPIPGTNYSYLQEDVTSLAMYNPVQNLTADSNFTAIAYGFGDLESYGYNAGTNIKDFSQFLTVKNPFPSPTFNNNTACNNNPFNLGIVLPFKPITLIWNFNSNPGISPNATITNNSPVPDSSYMYNGTTQYYYKLPGSYIVKDSSGIPLKVTVNNPTSDGCSGLQDIDYNINIAKPPSSDFTIQSTGCAKDLVTLTNTSNDNGISIVQYIWSLGNGTSTSNVNNPTITYNTPGNYTVKLRNINNLGCYSDTTAIIQLTSVPVAAFVQNIPACKSATTTFTDQSTIAVGSISNWYWDMGNGYHDTLNKSTVVSTVYDSIMSDTVRLTVLSNSGCKASTYKLVNVNYLPVAAFTTPDICLNDAFAQFNNQSTIADGTGGLFSYSWYFGDSYATATNPNNSNASDGIHKYSATGNYNISLKVTSNNGCQDSIIHAFTVNGSIPQANFKILNTGYLCSNDSVLLSNTSTVDFGRITLLQIYWDYGNQPSVMFVDSNPLPGKIYKYEYYNFHQPLSQQFSIRFIVYSGITCISSKDTIITVNASPEISYTIQPANTVCAGDTLTLAGTASGVTATIVHDWLWDMGNKNTIKGQNVLYPYKDSGTFNIVLQAATDFGCKENVLHTVTIYPIPRITLPDSLIMLAGQSVILPAIYKGSGLSYLWQPANYLNSIYVAEPLCTAANDTLYTIKATNNYFCSAKDSILVKVLLTPLIPNVFSPNGDGEHDTWHISFLKDYPQCTVEVFDRNGQSVFHSYNYYTEWDGTCNSKPVPVAVYYYVIKPGSGRQPITGSVTIIR